MNLYSPMFLFLFLPLVLAGYWCLTVRWRPGFLLLASIGFYLSASLFQEASGGGKGMGGIVGLLFYYFLVNYLAGLWLPRWRDTRAGRLLLGGCLALDLAPLAVCKYGAWLPLVSRQPHLVPLGLSFLSFQAMAYLVDVHREETAPQRNPVHFALFLTFFPKIAAGPILRHGDLAADLAAPRMTLDGFYAGVKRFTVGLGKKVLLADTLAQAADRIFSLPPEQLGCAVAWLGALTFTLQIYLDFSGYSDMAVGLGRMFGLTLPENFNYPYLSRSLTEFWRRWHISLSGWFRDYLFIPLSYALMTEGLRRRMARGECRTSHRVPLALVLVFALCGLWHGAGWNFLVWGLLQGAVMALESLWLARRLKRCRAALQHAYLMGVVALGWVLFREPTLAGALGYLKALAGLSAAGGELPGAAAWLDGPLPFALAAGALASFPAAGRVARWVEASGYRAACAFGELAGTGAVLLLTFCTVASSTFTPFLYQQF